jgi:hypothetical protein
MKRCPTCGRPYADNTLNFCLDDGSRLTIRIGAEATEQYSPRYTDPPITEVFPPASHGIGFPDIGNSSKLERPGTSSRKIHRLAITSLVLGLIPCTCVPSILAIILGHIALSRIASSPDRYRGRVMALWGTGLGYFFTVCNLIYGIIRGLTAPHQ